MTANLFGTSESTPGATRKKSFRPWRSLATLFAVFISLSYLIVTGNSLQPKLGLDLRGGTTIVLQPQIADVGKVTPESITQAISILRQRIDGVGVSESEIRAEGSGANTKIIVSVPGTTQRELVALVGQTAKLSIRPVLFAGSALTAIGGVNFPSYIDSKSRSSYGELNCKSEITSSTDDPSKNLFSCDESKSTKYVLGKSEVVGSQVDSSQSEFDNGLGWVTLIDFDTTGQALFGELSTVIATLPSPRNQIAIVLDGKVVTAARLDGPITGGSLRIYGNFTREYAIGLSNVLKYGALPFSFEVSEVQQISASLGAAQLKSGIAAGILGLLLISIYIFFYYRVLGILAAGSLLIAFLITYQIFVVLGGVIGGLNYGMFEERIVDPTSGRMLNPDMELYQLAGASDIPEIIVHAYEPADQKKRGVIGIGEPPTIGTAAAIGNAVSNAIGVRVTHWPMTPMNVLNALAQEGKA